MSTIGKLLERLDRVAQVSVVVSQVVGWADHSDVETVDHGGLADASVQHWVLSLGVGAHKDQEICLINADNSRVHEVLRSKVSIDFSLVAPHIDVLAVEAVEKILESNDALCILEGANDALNLLTLHTGELLSGH